MNTDPFSLEGKRILVTGASSGIGRQVAVSCAAMGATLVITGRNEARLQETFLKLDGAGHTTVTADLCAAEERARLADAALAINGVAHCAGITAIVPFRMIAEKHMNEMFDTNFRAPILLTQRLVAKKQVLPGGSIVFIAATAALIGPTATGMYAASKAALISAARVLALELGAKQKIRVNCVAPGYTRTPMLEGFDSQGTSMQANYALAPLGLGEPADVANAVVFFLSDASRWITRATFAVDGGLTSRVSC